MGIGLGQTCELRWIGLDADGLLGATWVNDHLHMGRDCKYTDIRDESEIRSG